MTALLRIFLIAFLALPALGQHFIHGIVYGEEPDGSRRPLPGARVQWLGTTVGTYTSAEGHFHLPRPAGADTLRVSSVGYRSRDTVLSGRVPDTVLIVLQAEYEVPAVAVEAQAPVVTAAPVKTELIGVRQLEQSACCSLAESFEKSPTVEATFSDLLTGARQIQLLGLSGAYVQTLVEAVPVLRGLSLPFQWEHIPGPFLESIAISKGAASVVDGYEGLTGTISVSYQKPFSAVPLFTNAYGSSAGRFELNTIAARPLSGGWQGMGFLHGRLAGWERDANGDGFIDMPLVRQLNGMVHLFRQGTPELWVIAKGLVEKRRGGTVQGIPGERAYHVRVLSRRGELIGKGTLELSPETQFGVRAALVGQQLQATLGRYPYSGMQWTGLLKALMVVDWENGAQLRYGLDMLVDTYDERFADTAWKRQELVPGAFLEATLRPASSLTVVAGLRGDWHNLYGGFLTPRAYVKWQPATGVTVRVSGGRGMRVPNPVADNLPFFLSSRRVLFGPISPEWGWNYGASVTVLLPLGSIWTLDGEFFRTEFRNQVVADLDVSPRIVRIGNVGRAYANSALVQAEGSIAGIEVRVAYRWWDTWAQTGGQWRRRPLVSPHRVLATLSYASAERRWQVDATVVWNSAGRIPSTAENPDSLRWQERFPATVRINGQLTRRFGPLDIYVGVENLTNTLQRAAVIDPANPNGPYFDASLVWGPLEARFVYAGMRWRLGQ